MRKRESTGKEIVHPWRGMSWVLLAGIGFLSCYALAPTVANADSAAIGLSSFVDSGLATTVNDDPPASAPAKEPAAEPKDEPAAKGAPVEKDPGQTLGNDPRGFVVKRSQIKPKDQPEVEKPEVGAASGGTQEGDKAKAGEKGCGSKPGEKAAPTPNPEGPQPKYICKETTNNLGEIWRGVTAVFTFTIGNEGEGALQIRLKGG
jgi:hypothetical protein